MNPIPTTVIPDPQSFLPVMPPLATVILHWIVVLVVGIYILGMALGLLWGYYKDNWVRQYKMAYPVTKWSQRFDLWLPMMANLPQFINKWFVKKGLPKPFKFVPDDLTVPPPQGYLLLPKTGPFTLIRDTGSGETRILSDLLAVAAGLPFGESAGLTAHYTTEQLRQGFYLGASQLVENPDPPAST